MKAKAKQRKATYAGKLGVWQRILAPLAANAADLLPHLEIPRTQLVALLTPAVGIQKQPAASPGDQEAAFVVQSTMLAPWSCVRLPAAPVYTRYETFHPHASKDRSRPMTVFWTNSTPRQRRNSIFSRTISFDSLKLGMPYKRMPPGSAQAS